ncbi:MAG: hypothetical protein KKG60_03965 [Nanoarchaeota archaeon]|nr:hypothetical protein [Nanoarchaeota archaeon]
MKTKGMAWAEKLLSITLILVALFVIYMFLPQSILKTGREFFDKMWSGEELVIDYVEADNTAQKSFDTIIEKIKQCETTLTKTDCLCSVNLNAFNHFYQFNLKEGEIEMVNIKGKTPLNVKHAEKTTLTCYINKDGKIQPTDRLNFKIQGEPYILLKKKFVFDGLKSDEELGINPTKHNIIKTSSGLCWVLETSKLQPGTKACAV